METNCWVMSEMAELGWVGGGVGLELEIYSINLGTSCRPRLYHVHSLGGGMGPLLKSSYLHLIVYYMILLHYITRQNRFTETGR